MVILDRLTYNKITDYLVSYRGLSIECEENVIKMYPDLPQDTIRSIISKHGQNAMRNFFYRHTSRADMILKEYEKRAHNDRALLDLSIERNFPPLGVCRMILNEKYSKTEVKEMLRDPDIIPDPMLSANVFTCIFNDIQDGVIIDMVRYTIGEEYEVKLKKMARDAGLAFFDEGDLRRDGFDKTPDLLLAVQCLYKNTIISWIESKASFGDCETHSKYLKEQLNCYENRFGNGIVIYWFGFEEEILKTKPTNLIVLDGFPSTDQLTTFDSLYSKPD